MLNTRQKIYIKKNNESRALNNVERVEEEYARNDKSSVK